MPVTAPIKPVDVYPVGLLSALQRDYRRLRNYRLARHLQRVGWATPRTLRYLAGRVRAGQWRAVKNTFNGYLAEPYDMPPGLSRCGSGWTRRRALRSLRRQYDRAGVAMPDV